MKPNESVWNPEFGFGKNAKRFQLPWKLIGGTVEDSIAISLNLNNTNSGKHCPKTDTGMTVRKPIFYFAKYNKNKGPKSDNKCHILYYRY